MPTPDRPATPAALIICGPCHRSFATAADLVAHVNSGHGRIRPGGGPPATP